MATRREQLIFSVAIALQWAAWTGLWLLKCIAVPFIRIRYWLTTAPKLPPIENKLLMHSATHLAHLIRTKQVTSEEIVQAYIKRVSDVNSLINAVVDERFEDALKEARAVDQKLGQTTKTAEQLEEELPLLGIPFTVKESIAVKGLSHTCGMRRRLGQRAVEDAESVRLMRKAGAIPLLVSNCPELCMSLESFNKITGITNNPYDVRRTSGGSSGGEAALLGAAASVIGLGSDIGGSCRIPAMFTGVFGHKPTSGLVCSTGHIPTSNEENWPKYFTIAPMVRYSVDLYPLLKIMSSENAVKLRSNEKVKISDMKVYYMEDDGGGIIPNRVNPEICLAMRKVLAYLEKQHNIHPQKVNIKDLKYAFDLTFATILQMGEVESVFQKGNDPKEWTSVTVEIIKYFLGLSSSTFPPILYGIVKKMAEKVPKNQVQNLIHKVESLQRQFKTMLGEDGVFLYPTFTEPADFHFEILLKVVDILYSAIFNILELPATNCPLGLTRGGLPISIQVVAGPYQDRLSIFMAQELEAAFGGWVPPPAAEVP